MAQVINGLEVLMEKATEYSQSSIELVKLRIIEKSADTGSKIFTSIGFFSIAILFILMLNITIACFLGNLMGKIYYGFLVLTIFYFALMVTYALISKRVSKQIKNNLIAQMIKP